MDFGFLIPIAVAALSLGWALYNHGGRKTTRARIASLEESERFLEASLREQENAYIRLEATYIQEKKNLEATEIQLKTQFKAMASDALSQNNTQFLEIAQMAFEKLKGQAEGDLESRQKAITELLTPVKEALQKVDEKIQQVESTRVGAYEGLKQQVSHLLDAQKELRNETANLVNALKKPTVRGRWGEMQLRRVVEMAGMIEYCDFTEQSSTCTEEGDMLRPDLVVKLPGGQHIVIDSKAPMSRYLEALEASDETIKQSHLQDHARHVRQHIKQLSAKSYWNQFPTSPEFVILFLPGETFFSAALEADPSLIEVGANHKVILATPTTLIALLRAVAYGWRQEQLKANAQEISQLGQTLYERLADLGGALGKVGRHLGQTVDAYNQSIGTLESRVLVSARRFEHLGISTHKKQLEPLAPVEALPRTPLQGEH